MPAIFNPEDLNALELALQIKDRYDAKVVVATMGPPNASKVLRDALCMGADEAVLLTDRAFAGSDTLATSYALSCCAKKIGDFDLILCGRQAIDGDTAQVGPQIAEKLAIPQISYVEESGQMAEFEKVYGEKGLLIKEWTAAETGADLKRCGLAGSPTKVKQIMSVVLTASDFKKIEPTEAGISNFIHELIEDHTLG